MNIKRIVKALDVMTTIAKQQHKWGMNILGIPVSDVEIIMDVLNKQLPKKVERRTELTDFMGDVLGIRGFCPGCGTKVESHRDRFCHDCGQRLDWSEEKEV